MTTEATTPFYNRSEEERIAITMAAIKERRTVFERWTVLASPEAEGWSPRASMAAELLADDASVADMGCGTMTLERYLRPSQAYFPIDVVARDSRTIVCDFNRELPPPTVATATACLGLLEYLHNLRDFLSVLSRQYNSAVVSYCVADAPEAPPKRREHAWVNDFDTAKLEQLFQATNWTILESRWIDKMQRIWRLRSLVRGAK